VTKPQLVISKLDTPGGDDKLKFKGSALVGATPPIDPLTNGVRVLIQDNGGGTILDAVVPGGAYDAITKIGWKVNGSGTTFKSRRGAVAECSIVGLDHRHAPATRGPAEEHPGRTALPLASPHTLAQLRGDGCVLPLISRCAACLPSRPSHRCTLEVE
jgi:hypothetical protein